MWAFCVRRQAEEALMSCTGGAGQLERDGARKKTQ